MSDLTRKGDTPPSPSGLTQHQTSAAGGGDALTTNPLSQFAATTSAQLAGVISDETGSGAVVFATSPTLVTPALGTPASGVITNCTGSPTLTAPNIGDATGSSLVLTQPSLGAVVWTLSSTATNDDVTHSEIHGRVATTDATVTAIVTYAIPASTTVFLNAWVTARRTGGVAGAAEDGAAYQIQAAVKNVAGTATLIGSASAALTREDQAAWNCTIAVSAGNAIVRVTGAADNNVTWHATVDVRQVSS